VCERERERRDMVDIIFNGKQYNKKNNKKKTKERE